MTTPTATPSAGEPVAWMRQPSEGWEVHPKFSAERLFEDDIPLYIQPSHDTYPWLARGAIPPYQPPFPG